MVVGRYMSADVMNPRGGYQEPFVVTTPIVYHKDGHYVWPNWVAFKYHDFKKDVDPNVHVKVFKFLVKSNAKTFKEYIINVLSYMLRDTTLDRCHNYMLKFPNYICSKLTHAFCKHHQETHNDEQIYMELKNMK